MAVVGLPESESLSGSEEASDARSESTSPEEQESKGRKDAGGRVELGRFFRDAERILSSITRWGLDLGDSTSGDDCLEWSASWMALGYKFDQRRAAT
jgi:hypothetical protein